MAYAMKNYRNPYQTLTGNPYTTPSTYVQLADKSCPATLTTIDFGGASYRNVRVVFYGKSIGSLVATDVMLFTLRVGTGASLTSPIDLIQKSVVMQTGDTTIEFEACATAETAFESLQIRTTSTSSHTLTYDLYLEVS
jgi:hypothetical protein